MVKKSPDYTNPDVIELYNERGIRHSFVAAPSPKEVAQNAKPYGMAEALKEAQKRGMSEKDALHLTRATSAAASNSKKSSIMKQAKDIIKGMMSGMFSVAGKISPSSTPKGQSASKLKWRGQ